MKTENDHNNSMAIPTSLKKVLVVDDNLSLGRLWKRALERENFFVETAENGQEGFEKAVHGNYSIIFSDLDMPVMDGKELTRELKKINHQACVNIITGKGSISSSVDCMRMGACDYVMKPVDLPELVAMAYRCMGHHQVRQENARLLEKINQLNDLSELKTEFVSNVSHELRTPLFSLGTAAELLLGELEKDLTADQRKLSSVILENYERLTDMVTRVLNFSRLEQGRLKPTSKKIDYSKIAAQTAASLEPLFQKNDLAFLTDIQPGKIIGFGDPDMIRQIITNLLGNAIKFTPSGKKIGLRVKEEKGAATIQVWDQGKGIPEDKIDLIFNRFYQVDGGLTRSAGGAGIGLSLVKSFTEIHGGSVHANSALGKGTEFTVCLPLNLEKIEEGENNV